MTLANTPSMSVDSPWTSMQLSCRKSLAMGGIWGGAGGELGGGVTDELGGGVSCGGDSMEIVSLAGAWS